ncbi:four helix bundle protein [Niabella ginsengisoli]|uniref:Four helix bundle protein n=1 Tax=Niabella ginsengisoli TaxID=522298 RepID=A0ABS9SG99_9BACT|nr:four helix bundle protein [Niabella ginsengisoli]MCH5597386.1 four helix bundle protein [Niabella ginsengisoli]
MLQLAHKNLTVYQFALQLVKEVYQHTKSYPKEEQFVLVSQLRRAAISVCSNLAEGSARTSKTERKRFYEISRSSLVEVDTQIEISLVLEYLQKEDISSLENYLESVFKMLSKMIGNLKIETK